MTMTMKVNSALLALGLCVLAAGPVAEAAKGMRVELRLQPALELDGTERIFVGPVLLEPTAADPSTSIDLTAVREFESYVRKLLRRRTRLNLIPADDELKPPVSHLNELLARPDFWAQIRQETGADYVVAASIDVEVLDREGYTTEEYVSPQDGKTYFRQVLVEETGFDYDILVVVVDARTGEQVHEELITDFKERPKRQLSVYKDMFNELYNLENRLLGVFVPRTMIAKRFLYTK